MDAENLAIFQALAQELKAQAVHLRNLHESYAALFDALKIDHPELERNFQKQMETIRLQPETQARLDAIDVLLQELKISG
jgi:hypothetical protein